MAERQDSTGIILYRASRLEALLDPLLALLDAAKPAHVLAPQTVIAAHPGMRQWLLGALAERRGPGQVVANLDVVLPGAWLDRLARRVLGADAPSPAPYRREVLRWRIHDALGGLDDARMRAYLHGHDAERRRFQLADRLARIYSQYLVYRTDWLAAWAAGRNAIPDAGLVAPLWRRLRSAIGVPHRGERLGLLIAKLASFDATDPVPLHVFGLSHLAPTDLAVLRAVSRQRLVVFYVPDPCREFWGGMGHRRTQLLEQAQRAPDATQTETSFLQLPHPLLGRWGRIGQHFLLLLEEGEIVIDERHYLDKPDAAIAPGNRLEWLQEGVRRGVIDLAMPQGSADAARRDGSLRVHACHTRLRELEVLRDALLDALARDPALKPSRMVVMATDIQAYAPLLPAVFGEAGRMHGPLPYHLADVPIARAHRLFDAFARLLDLPRSRMTAPEVVDLLGLPAIARRFDLGGGDLEAIARWLRNGRVAWALDGRFRARFDVPPIETQTFAWGMDRMLAGYAIGREDAQDPRIVALPDGTSIAPLDGLHGPQAWALGAFDAAMVEFAQWCALGERTLRAGAWAHELAERLQAVLRIDPDERTDRDAWDALVDAIGALATEPAESGLDPPLAFDVVRDWLHARLDAVSERQRFLAGGVTFCGMVPQRAIPFGFVAVLGLDEGAFPRTDNDAGLDPIGAHRRIGDRDVRNDDRWLFLQTVMSARSCLHLSYIGCGAHKGEARNPAAPLADLMNVLDRGTREAAVVPACDADLGDTDHRPWLVRHPLQPFDARYFDQSDPALFTYRNDFARMGQRERGAVESTAALACVTPVVEERVALRAVLAWFKDPAREYLTRHAKLRLDALADDRLGDSEPLEVGFDRIERVGRRLFFDAIANAVPVLPDRAPDWLRLSGLLPEGELGAATWNAETEHVAPLIERASIHPLFADGMPVRAALSEPPMLDGCRIEGDLPRAYQAAGIRWIFDVFPGKKASAFDFGQRVGLFVEWALLRLDDPHVRQGARMCVLCDGDEPAWQTAINAWDATCMAADVAHREAMLRGLRSQLMAVFACWRELHSDPRWYFARTSWAAANASPDAASDTAAGAWDGHDGRGERNYTSGYERLLAPAATFARGSDERTRLDALASRLLAAITPTMHTNTASCPGP